MPARRVLAKHLTNPGAKGKFPVAELLVEHVQKDCTPVPKGTRGLITSVNWENGKNVFLFPHAVLPDEMRVFSDGHIRIVPSSDYKIIGRVDI